MHRFHLGIVAAALLVGRDVSKASAGPGTEALSFLDIPVGAAPAALGSAYTSRAMDAYAPVWNPAGLGFNDNVRLSGTHLTYLQGVHYEYLGTAIPLGTAERRRGLAASVQYLGSGEILGADDQGNITGSFTSDFAAYSLSWGQKLTPRWALGITGKALRSTLADVSSNGFAGDIGTLFQWNDQVMLAASAVNLGPDFKTVNQEDPLPAAIRGGANLLLLRHLDVSVEAVYRRTGMFSAATGVQWTYANILALRGGLDSSRVKGLSGLSAISAGVGLKVFGQELAYAWLPYGELGSAHYVSLDMRFGARPEEKEKAGLLKIDNEGLWAAPAAQRQAQSPTGGERMSSDYELLEQVLTDSERKALSPGGPAK